MCISFSSSPTPFIFLQSSNKSHLITHWTGPLRAASRLTHLELQRSAALGRLAHTVDGEAAVLAVVRLPGVRDEEHLAVLPGHVALAVPGNGWVWVGGWGGGGVKVEMSLLKAAEHRGRSPTLT